MINEIFESSDWHSKPDHLPEAVKLWIRRGKTAKARLVSVGDEFDLLPLGKDAFIGCQAIKELIVELDGYPLWMVAGNHNPFLWMQEVVRESNIYISRSHKVAYDGGGWYFEHGHRRTPDWAILRHCVPNIVEWMMDHAPSQWYWICKEMGWLASNYHPAGSGPVPPFTGSKEQMKYNELVGLLHSIYLKQAEATQTSIVIGHTHKAFLGYSWTGTRRVFLVDGGDLREGSYVRIARDKAWVEWL